MRVDGNFLAREVLLAKNSVFVSFFALVSVELLTLAVVLAFWNASNNSGRRSVTFATSDMSRWASFSCLVLILAVSVAAFIYFFLTRTGGSPRLRNSDIGTLTSVTDNACIDGYYDWQKLWTASKQAYCCDKMERACPDETVYKTETVHAPIPARQIIYKERTVPVPMQEQVIKYRYEGVPAPPPAQKTIVHYKYKYMYKTTTPFDCDAGFSGGRWKIGWSHAKKEWCCEHKSRGCLRWDCNRGFHDWYHEWSHDKKEWCCEYESKGCGLPVTSLPFTCTEQPGDRCWNTWGPKKKEWCCAVQPDETPKHCCKKPVEPMGTCKLWGDPHIVTFDKSHLVFYSEGDFWIVKSKHMKIQGRFQATKWTRDNDHTDYSSMTSIILTGNAMDGNKLEVQSMQGSIKCNGEDILKGFGNDKCGPATINFDSQGKLVDAAMSFLPHNVVHIEMPDGAWIQVNRWPNFINALVSMHPVDDQDGVCGNFNGISSDDSGKELHSRFGRGVEEFEDLFSDYLPVSFPKAKPSAKRCDAKMMTKAATTCTHRVAGTRDGWSFAECMGDYCDKFKNGGSYEAELLKQQMEKTE